jgi:type I restriction enzyme, S subunit
LINGRSVQTDSNGFPVLRLTALRNGRLALSERKSGRWTAADATPFLVRKGDFFISRGNGSLSLVGRGALLEDEPDPVAFPDTMVRIRVDEQKISPQFLRLVWGSLRVRTEIERSARTTAGIYKINQQIIEAIRIPVSEIGVQKEVVTQVREVLSGVDRVGGQIQLAAGRAERLRHSLLAQAFAGRLVEQDSADEPASLLLERAKEERAAQGLTQRRSRDESQTMPQKETLL